MAASGLLLLMQNAHVFSTSADDSIHSRISIYSGSTMIETGNLNMMPSVFGEPAPALSDFVPFGTNASQPVPQANSAPSFPWLDMQQSGEESRGFETEQSSSAPPMASSRASPPHGRLASSVAWAHGDSDVPASLFPSSARWDDHPYQFGNDLTTPFQMSANHVRRPFSPLPRGPGPHNLWRNSAVTSTLNEIRNTPHPQLSRAYAFDAAFSSGPSLYPTALNEHKANQPAVKRPNPDVDDIMTVDSYETDSESNKGEPPYATLIYNALMDAPDHKLVLRDIYAWISDNTDKAKDPAFKGWQNSVRHNLSMNGAFIKVPHVDPANKHKKGFIWVLDPSAVGKGIESTTRYRQKTAGRRSDMSETTDPKRQRSGRKGGRAARQSARLRRSAKLYGRKSGYTSFPENLESDNSISSPSTAHGPLSPDLSLYHLGGLPYYVNTPPTQSPIPGHSFYDHGAPSAATSLPPDQTFFGNSFDSSGAFRDNELEDSQGAYGLKGYA